jgi:DNA adenine methylase
MGKEAPKIKAIAPWFGGKRTMAPLIVAELGKHVQYFEPFCGSMAVIFFKTPSRCETVNDLHGDLINLARVLQDPAAAATLYDRLQTVLFSEDLLTAAADHLDDESSLSLIVSHEKSLTPVGIERAYWFFLASWMMRNGVAGTARVEYQVAVRWTKNGGSPTLRFRHAVESIPAWHERLRNVVIIRRDAFSFIHKFEDCKETAIYVDPPYISDSRSGFGNHGNGSKYKHEFDHENPMFGDDHKRLAEILGAYKKARIVVSYYDHPRVRELYRGWTFVDCTRQKHLHSQNGRGARKQSAPELLIINGPSYAKE